MPLQLADRGFDVWLGNNKGTHYSQVHDTYDPRDSDFWQFDWSEMGIYDDVANVKMIKEKTGSDKIYYLGYSQGTT